jgi:hypothetical protein
MAMRLVIPLGAMPDDQIKDGVLAVTEKLRREFLRNFGDAYEITMEHVNTQHEVLRDEVTVAMKYVEYQIDLRNGVTTGARIRIVWNWNKKDRVQLTVASATKFEGKVIKGAMVAALIVAALIIVASAANSTSDRTMAGIAFFIIFMILFAVFLIPYPFIRIYFAVHNNKLVEQLAATASAALAPK